MPETRGNWGCNDDFKNSKNISITNRNIRSKFFTLFHCFFYYYFLVLLNEMSFGFNCWLNSVFTASYSGSCRPCGSTQIHYLGEAYNDIVHRKPASWLCLLKLFSNGRNWLFRVLNLHGLHLLEKKINCLNGLLPVAALILFVSDDNWP